MTSMFIDMSLLFTKLASSSVDDEVQAVRSVTHESISEGEITALSPRRKLLEGDCVMAVAIFVGVLIAIFLPMMSEELWRAEQDRARARRIADAKMNARLLRLDI